MSDPVERLLDLGLRNRWYPVCPSWWIKDKPVAMTRLGEGMVVWRDKAGAVHALQDRCPHRGARLSQGFVAGNGDRLQCWYHGVEVKSDGVVAAVPAVDACPLVGQRAVKSYPVREIQGGVFAYFGDALHSEPCELVLPEELANPGAFGAFLCTARWECNNRYALENVIDPMHGTFLHSVSHSMSEGARTARMAIRKTPHGFYFEKKDQQNVNFDWVEVGDTGTLWMRLSIPYQKKFGPGGPFFINAWATPIDENTTQFFAWRLRKVQGWQRDLWNFFYKTRLEGPHWDVLEQDRAILEAMAENARDHEFLYQHDMGVAHLRRMLLDEAKAQVAALDAAKQRQDIAAE
ncbi:MAG TPA: aromatic ring-hydroxylating dioxygenase subunit alpha [Alphaproteobacteria bacterium]